VDDINAGLGASARIPVANAAQILDCAARVPFGPAAFDPYREFRAEPIYSPHCPDLPTQAAPEAGKETIVYLHDVAQRSEPLMAALESLKPAARIYIPTLSTELRERLSAEGHTVEDRMMPLSLLAERAGLLLHQGGVTLCAAALALGIRQIILARFYENGLAGRFVASEGLGLTKRMDKARGDWIRYAVSHVRSSPEFTDRARRRMLEFRAWFAEDPTGVVARKAGELLGLTTSLAVPAGANHEWSPI
jgi:hypothetical protein